MISRLRLASVLTALMMETDHDNLKVKCVILLAAPHRIVEMFHHIILTAFPN